GYQPGRFPIIAAGELPFLLADAKGGSAALDVWYRKYAGQEMKDVKFCLGFTHDPGSFHANKKIVVPGDRKGMKIRPADATIAEFVTLLGGTNVQAAAPEVRDILEKRVADAVTFPWGSIPLFGIDKVVKYHMDVAFYTTTFAWVINKAKYDGMSAAQKKVIDDHCTTERTLRIASPWAGLKNAAHPTRKPERGPEIYSPTPAQLGKGRKAAEPLQASWAAKVRKVGLDPDTVLNELKASLTQYKAAY